MAEINKKILIVEDEKEFLWILKENIAAEGFYVVTAPNGEEGFIAAEKEKPDLILLDIQMPKMDGITLAKKLREAKNNALIIFLTNMKDEMHISQAMEAVPKTEYIIKSDMDINSIIARIKNRLDLKK